MNEPPPLTASPRSVVVSASLSAVLLWLAQPPCILWPLSAVALVPWIGLIARHETITRRGYWILWAIASLYFLVSLQGLRHAHPAMYACWIALAGYLGVYPLLFVRLSRRFRDQGLPLAIVVPLVWVSLELVRNYMLTGLSVLMLGHSLADVPHLIQIADLFGTYGVSLLLVMVNVAIWMLLQAALQKQNWKESLPASAAALVAVLCTLAYGHYRIGQPLGQSLATFALIQRNEPVEYGQPIEREVEMYQNYSRQSVETARRTKQDIDVVVWPESMFSGGTPWMIADRDAVVPEGAPMSEEEFQSAVKSQRSYFLERAGYVQQAIASEMPAQRPPHLIAGCGVVYYRDTPEVYSGVISLRPDGTLQDWYGKTHLVMFGEYIPIAPSIPGLKSLMPPGMGLQTGKGAKLFEVGETTVAPNLCIETAVERVTVNQMNQLRRSGGLPDVIVTVTNDGWFDDSSVLDHHLRCAQLVAVGCRRPILSAANNGPTAWIDSCGRIVERLDTGVEGAVIATPQRDDRTSLYVRIGDWPARIATLLCGILFAVPYFRKSAP